MPHGDVNTFAASLVEMALATKRVPELEAINKELTKERDEALDRIAQYEVRSVQRRIEVEQLHARIRELEVQRDDAELRFLEADDAKATAIRTLRLLMGEAHSAIEAIEPTPVPTPPVVEAVPVTEVKLVDSPLSPIGDGTSTAPQSSADGPQGLVAESSPKESPAESPTVPSAETGADASPGVEQGQSAADPTAVGVVAGNSGSHTASALGNTSAHEEVAVTGPFAPSSSGDQSSAVGEGASGNASSPTPLDPEPRDQLSDAWWAWHRRNHPEMYQSHSAA